MSWHRVAPTSEILAAGRRLFNVGDSRLAVFRISDNWVAIDNHCPHRGGPIAAGTLVGACIACPWHGAQFNLLTGEPLSMESRPLTILEVRESDGFLEVDTSRLTSPSSDLVPEADGIFRYLIRYGQGSEVGFFGSVHNIECGRGERVVVQTRCGMEIGEILKQADATCTLRGELLRKMTEEDDALDKKNQSEASERIEDVSRRLKDAELAVQVVEAHQTLDAKSLVFFFIGQDETGRLGPFAIELGDHFGIHVRFEKLELDSA